MRVVRGGGGEGGNGMWHRGRQERGKRVRGRKERRREREGGRGKEKERERIKTLPTFLTSTHAIAIFNQKADMITCLNKSTTFPSSLQTCLIKFIKGKHF